MGTKIETDEAYSSSSPLSQAIRSGDTVYVSGQVPMNAAGDIVGSDVGSQTEQVIDNVERILEAAGLGLEDVVKATVYLTTMDEFAAFNEAYARRFPDPKPARSAVRVADLAVDVDIEIDVIAVERCD